MPNKNNITPVSITEFDLAADLRRKRKGGTITYNTVVNNPVLKELRLARTLLFRTLAFVVRSAKQAIFDSHHTAQYEGAYPAILEGGGGIAYNTWYALNFHSIKELNDGGGMADGAIQLYDVGGSLSDWCYVAGRHENIQISAYCYVETTRAVSDIDLFQLSLFHTPNNSTTQTEYMPFGCSGATSNNSSNSVACITGVMQINLNAGDELQVKLRNIGNGISPVNAGDIVELNGYVSIHTTKLTSKNKFYDI